MIVTTPIVTAAPDVDNGVLPQRYREHIRKNTALVEMKRFQ